MSDSHETPKTLKKSQLGQSSIDIYAVQCGQCNKWRVIPTQEEFEGIRSRFMEEPFFCNNKPNVSCEDPADIEYDATRTWVIDKPNIPKTPEGFKRQLVIRKDFSKMDAYYIAPTGKKMRARSEVSAFLDANPKYKGISVSDFNFHVPKVMTDTVPGNVERKGSASGKKGSASGNKKIKIEKDIDV